MADESRSDQRLFRDLAGRFATGVTVVTLRNGGEPLGMTASAFSSVSLEPRLILVCIDRGASAYSSVEAADAFVVNILSQEQEAISRFFARTGRGEDGDAMGGYGYRDGATGSPILDGTLGWLDCRPWQRYDGGDHTIVVGEVVDFELSRPDGDPLLFFSGGYRDIGTGG
ncbi:MAG: flavin reductase family protein [Dehalococcoidia bacterium]